MTTMTCCNIMTYNTVKKPDLEKLISRYKIAKDEFDNLYKDLPYYKWKKPTEYCVIIDIDDILFKDYYPHPLSSHGIMQKIKKSYNEMKLPFLAHIHIIFLTNRKKRSKKLTQFCEFVSKGLLPEFQEQYRLPTFGIGLNNKKQIYELCKNTDHVLLYTNNIKKILEDAELVKSLSDIQPLNKLFYKN